MRPEIGLQFWRILDKTKSTQINSVDQILLKGLRMTLVQKVALSLLIAGAMPLTANAQGVAGYLSNVKGQVLIERGGQLFQATEQSALLAGDKVITSNNASTDITLNDCRARLQNTQSVNLGFSNHCANVSQATNPQSIPALRTGRAPIGTFPQAPAINPALLVAGAGILAGAAIALASGGGDDDDPAVSP